MFDGGRSAEPIRALPCCHREPLHAFNFQVLGRVLVSLLVGIVASALVWFVLAYVGVGSAFTALVAIGVGVAWAAFAFLRS